MADSQSIRTLPGFSRYQFRADGEVFSLEFGRVLQGGTDKDGYRKFVLIDDDRKRRYVRRATAICEAFHGPRPAGMNVRHLDGTRTNDAPDNLEWATQKENIADKVRHGTAQRGAKNPRATLTTEQVLEIRRNPSLPAPVLARLTGSSRNAIYAIRHGMSWRWLE